jgi:hypothetical protein
VCCLCQCRRCKWNFFDLLRNTYPVDLDDVELRETNCFTQNPVTPGRKFNFFHFFVHLFKAIRNNLHNSNIHPFRRKNGTTTKSLRTHYCNQSFGWENIQQVFDNDNNRASNGLPRLSRLRHEDVDLDSWRKMRVGSAKKVFTPETIRAVLHISITETHLHQHQNQTTQTSHQTNTHHAE